MGQESESIMSGEGGSHAQSHPGHASHITRDRSAIISSEAPIRQELDRLDSVMPDDSASHNGVHDEVSAVDGAADVAPFTFKFKAPSGRMHRLHVIASSGLEVLIAGVAEKLGGEAEGLGGVPSLDNGKLGHAGFALSYLDNEGDTVSITTDHDLIEAISLARAARKDKVDLFVHHPEKPAIPPTLEPQPAVVPRTPPESQARRRKQFTPDEEDDATERRSVRKAASQDTQDQIIQGVSNDLLLPAALVVLGVAIVLTFAVARSGR